MIDVRTSRQFGTKLFRKNFQVGNFLSQYKVNRYLASSVNLYRFTHFLDFPSGSIFVNCLLGKHPQSPLNATCSVGYAFILNTFTSWLLRNLHRSSIFYKRKNENMKTWKHGRSCHWLFMWCMAIHFPTNCRETLWATRPQVTKVAMLGYNFIPSWVKNFVPTWHKVKNVGNRKTKITST